MTRTLAWTLHPMSGLAACAGDWDVVNARAGALPFMESTFLLPLARHFARGGERIAIARCGAQPCAAAIVAPAGAGRWATWQPPQLPLGPWLVAPGVDGEDAADSLLRQLPGFALSLGLTQVDPQLLPRAPDTPRRRTLDYIDTAWIEVGANFDAFWEARGKNLRSNMRKQRSKLTADGVRLRFDEIVEASAVAAAITEYGQLESASWKAAGGTSVRADNVQGQFYVEMMQAFCRAGRGRIWRLAFDDRPVALDLCVQAGTTLVMLKTTFDARQRLVSPAFLLKQEAFESVFHGGGVRRVEFYGRLMEWHTRWTEHRRRLYHANIYRWGWLGNARDLLRGRSAPPQAQPASPASPDE